jgi:hypothetical protein
VLHGGAQEGAELPGLRRHLLEIVLLEKLRQVTLRLIVVIVRVVDLTPV